MNIMMNWFRKLFRLEAKKPDDWEIIWNAEGVWIGDLYGGKSYCYYYIRYSPSRRKIILKVYGKNPFEHRQCSTTKLALSHYKKLYRSKNLID